MSHHPATLLPWRVDALGIIVSDHKPFPESVCRPKRLGDANHIATACNCHNALFNALRELHNATEEIISVYSDAYKRLEAAKRQARAALQMADTEEDRDADRYEQARHDAQLEREADSEESETGSSAPACAPSK